MKLEDSDSMISDSDDAMDEDLSLLFHVIHIHIFFLVVLY